MRTNYIEVDPATAWWSVNQTAFSLGKFPIYEVVVSAGSATITDKRTIWSVDTISL